MNDDRHHRRTVPFVGARANLTLSFPGRLEEMMPRKVIRVLVVDDSAVLRQQISDIVNGAEGLEAIGIARDGIEAIEKIEELQPDIVTLDVQMPRMDGLATLDAILLTKPLPVIMVSALTQRAADVTLQALERGALDYITKPENLQATETVFRDELLRKLRMMAGADVERVLRVRRSREQRSQLAASPTSQSSSINTSVVTHAFEDCCIAVGISTGGPPALSRLFQDVRPPLPAIVVVQHMPADFTGPFARRLDSISALSVKEAEEGDVLRPNQVYVAPGGRHLRLMRKGHRVVVRICDSDPVSGHRPSVDVMMKDAAEAYRERTLGVIMTGMGHDGAEGCRAIREVGGVVLGQDEASSDVYGMNKVAFAQGHVDRQFSLAQLPQLISLQCRKMFRLEAVK